MTSQPDEEPRAPSALWIEWTDSTGEEAAGRWGAPVTDAQIDAAIEAVEKIIGRPPDTIT